MFVKLKKYPFYLPKVDGRQYWAEAAKFPKIAAQICMLDYIATLIRKVYHKKGYSFHFCNFITS